MDDVRVIEVKQSVFADNDRKADELRARLREQGTFLLNLMSSPGSGKTTTLTRTVEALRGEMAIAVMEADVYKRQPQARGELAGFRNEHRGGRAVAHIDGRDRGVRGALSLRCLRAGVGLCRRCLAGAPYGEGRVLVVGLDGVRVVCGPERALEQLVAAEGEDVYKRQT